LQYLRLFETAGEPIPRLTKEQRYLREFFFNLANDAVSGNSSAAHFCSHLNDVKFLEVDDMRLVHGGLIFMRSDLSKYEWTLVERVHVLNILWAKVDKKEMDANDVDTVSENVFPSSLEMLMDAEGFKLFLDVLTEGGFITTAGAQSIWKAQNSKDELLAGYLYTPPSTIASHRPLNSFSAIPLSSGAQRYHALQRLVEAAVYKRRIWKGTHYGDAAASLNECIMTYAYTRQGVEVPRHLVDEVRDWTHDEQRLLDRAIMVMEYRKRLDMRLLSFSVFKIIRESLVGLNDLFLSFKGLNTALYSKASDQESGLTVSEVPGILIMHPKFDVETKYFAGKRDKLNELLAVAYEFQKAENERLADIKAAKKAFIKGKSYDISLLIGYVTDILTDKSRFTRV
jgi:hypothetical protein